MFSTNCSPVFRLMSFRKDCIKNLRILKLIFFLMLPICSKPHGKLFCISKGTYTYFNLETTYHHLSSPRISQHHPFWNPAIHFHPHFLAPRVMVIAARWIFYKLKSCLFSANPFQMVSHGSWDKEANFQQHLLALHDSDLPGPCSLPCTHHGGAPMNVQLPPSYLSASLSLLTFWNTLFSFPFYLLGFTQIAGLQLKFCFLWKLFQIPEKLNLL